MGTDLGVDAWDELVPKILKVAQEEEGNTNTQGVLASVEECQTVSEGIQAFILNLHVCSHNFISDYMHVQITCYNYELYNCLYTEYNCILAMCLLYYLAPDVRTKPDATRVVSLLDVSVNVHIFSSIYAFYI